MAIARKGVGESLLERQLITPAQFEEAKAAGGDIRKFLVDKGYAAEVDVYKAWADSEGLSFVDLNKHKPEASALNVVPQSIVVKHSAVPVRKDGQTLWVAMENPRNIVAVDDIRAASRMGIVRPVAAAPSDIAAAIKANYADTPPPSSSAMQAATPAGGGIGDIMKIINSELTTPGGKELDEGAADEAEANQAPVVRMVNAILVQAIDTRASDIHIEPNRRNVRVRYRVDGVLREIMSVPKHIQAPMIARCKIMSDMNIAERRIPQDGRIGLKHNNKDYDMRVSCLPSMYGEKIVMRILDKTSTQIGLGKLGFLPEIQGVIEELVEQPNGMFIVTGPTGSGKTTTLYSVLNKLNKIDRNIITIEDPVEYELQGVTQVQINKKAGLNFSNALRCFLRQDPDIIMVGEMRDLETADIAIEAALTGHMVLSTLHTNDAPSATLRLADMGVEPFLISATLIGILAQRLARTSCADCKEPYTVAAGTLRRFGFGKENTDILQRFGIDPDNEAQDVTLYKGRGCDSCGGTGFRGRTGIHELLVMNSEVAELVVRRAPLADITDAAKRNGMRQMPQDGLIKILNGVTTPEEVMRVVFTAGH
jgi:type IV pilus assembly protein PilB